MGRDGKFGTFGGVFTPSILTILGVIMYLRLPWLVGSAGLYMALGIILVAHVVSVTTGLSISSIATDKKVGAGGPYYIISRSFGLPIGGAVGLALFLGLSFSISLYLVGFSESFLAAIGIEPTKNAIRVCGSVTIVALTILTFISTSLAIKAQYLILVIIALSLVSVFLGTSTTATPQLSAPEGGPPFALLFGIFFPAVTGFTAGVNMSGDLRDPKGSIPRGTMLAIGAGLIIYVGMAVFLGLRVDGEVLRGDPQALENSARVGALVVAGIWSATLSSALGSILGAPRILQAMSADRITPRVFARGYGPTSEPRNALLLAFAIGEGGILIAELDIIARVVSMVFLAMYAAVNITCVIESWASSDFRPRFRIPRIVSIIGAVTAILLMIQLDIVAMLAATLFMLVAYGLLQRRQLTLEAGDTWDGVWSAVVRAGLHRLHKRQGPQRNWRPNVLLFDEAGHPKHPAVRGFATTLASGNGMVTDFALGRTRHQTEPGHDDAAITPGLFDRKLVTSTPLETVATICQHHGFSGIAPNTLLLPWRQHAGDPEAFLRALRAAGHGGLNILLFEEARDAVVAAARARRIDLWWSRDRGNLALGVALLRFITRAPAWERAAIQILLVGEDTEQDELWRVKAERYLDETRVDARVRVVIPARGQSAHDLAIHESRDAQMILFGLPDDLARTSRATLDELEGVAALPGATVFVRASELFPDVLTVTARASRTAASRRRTEPTAEEELGRSGGGEPAAERVAGPGTEEPAGAAAPPLELPSHPELAAAVTAMHLHLRTTLARSHEHTVARIYDAHIALCDAAHELVQRRADAITAAVAERNPSRRKKLVNRASSRFLVDAERLLVEFEDRELEATASLMADQIGELVREDAWAVEDVPPVLRIRRPRADFRAAANDSPALRRWKRRRRWRYFYRRQIPQTIPTRDLSRQSHDRLVCDVFTGALQQFRRDSHEVLLEVGRALGHAEWRAIAELSRTAVDDPDLLVGRLAQTRDATLDRLDGVREHARLRLEAYRDAADPVARKLARHLSASLARVDAPARARAAARRDRGDLKVLEALPAVPPDWQARQRALLKRLRLGARLTRFRVQLTAAAVRHIDELLAGVRGSGARACGELREALTEAITRGDGAPLTPDLRDDLPYEPGAVMNRFARGVAGMTGELPETETVLTDEAVVGLVDDAALDVATLSVRGAVQALVEADLISQVQAEVARLMEVDARAWGAARDTVSLLAAQSRAASGPDDEEDEGTGAAAIEHSIARLEAQLAALAGSEAAVTRAMFGGLEAVSTATGLDRLASSFEAIGRRGRTSERPSRLRAAARRGAAGVRELGARAIYRRSAGVVFARESRDAGRRSGGHAIRELTARSAPDPAVLADVPLTYRHLFTGQVNINEAFFVGRSDTVAEALRALGDPRGGGGPRAVLVTGERGAGKTTLLQQIAIRCGASAAWVLAPLGGACRQSDLRAALETAVGERGTPSQILQRLAPGSLVVIDDLDLWWERRPGGLEAIDELLSAIRQAPDHLRFLLAGSSYSVRVLDRLRAVSSVTAGQLSCLPLTAGQLEQVVMSRHGSTGLEVRLEGRTERPLGPWSRARLFDKLFDYSDGNVGYALRAWMAHVEDCQGNTLILRAPRLLDWDALDDLRPELVSLLIELMLHRGASAEKLERITGRPGHEVRDSLAELCALGMALQSRRHIAQVNPHVQVPLTGWLERRELA